MPEAVAAAAWKLLFGWKRKGGVAADGILSGGRRSCRRNKIAFLYTGQRDVPRDVTHVRVDQSVKVIGEEAFSGCHGLLWVELCEAYNRRARKKNNSSAAEMIGEGLEKIGAYAFNDCRQLKCLRIPHTVKSIGLGAFDRCRQLVEVELSEGLEQIESQAFSGCSSLKRIKIPSTVKVIASRAFFDCQQLAEVELREGLERIESRAFALCESLTSMKIPSSVVMIDHRAFNDCAQLTALNFCEGIERVVSDEPIRSWWKHGVPEHSLKTYCFLVEYNIPDRVSMLGPRKWRQNIDNMLKCMPSIAPDEMESYCDSIHSKLVSYEYEYLILKDAAHLLELCLWKSKLLRRGDTAEVDSANVNRQHLFNCGATVIIPNVLPFLASI